MNIILINHYAGGMKFGMEFRPYYFARRWVEMGHKITIVASSFSHLRNKNPDMGGSNYKEEEIDGIRYVWIAGNHYQGNGLGRIRNMFSFLRGLYAYKRNIIGSDIPDVVIASSTYPLDFYPARKIARICGAKVVFELHDLWPLSPMLLGNMSKNHPYIKIMQRAEDDWCKGCDKVISLLPCARDYLVSRGLDPEKFVYIPNGIVKGDWNHEGEGDYSYSDILARYKDEGWFLVGYTGAHGIANALNSYVEAGALLRGEKVKLLAVGSGPQRERLMKKVVDLGLKQTVELLPAIPRSEIPQFLEHLDVAYIGFQRQPLFKYGVSPNKLMDYMMAAKPVIFAADAGNDIVSEAHCGITIDPENSEAIAAAVLKLKGLTPEERESMGLRGREYILANHEYDVLAKRFIDAITFDTSR